MQELTTDFEAPADDTFYFYLDNSETGQATPNGESVDVHILIEEKTSGILTLAMIGAVAAIVIGVVVWYFKFKK